MYVRVYHRLNQMLVVRIFLLWHFKNICFSLENQSRAKKKMRMMLLLMTDWKKKVKELVMFRYVLLSL